MAVTSINRQRIEYLDIMKGIAILLVVIGHSIHMPDYPTELACFIYTFHMPLFFIAAGMVVRPCKGSRWQGLSTRFLALMVPYYLWCMIYMDCTAENFGHMFYASFFSIKSMGCRCLQMWFLPCLFVCEVMIHFVLYVAERIRKNRNAFLMGVAVVSYAIGFLLPKIEGGYPFNLDVSFVALGIMLGGYVGRNNLMRFDSKPFVYQVPFFLVSTTMLLIGFTFVPDKFVVSMCVSSYGNVFWFLWNALFGIIMVRSFSSMLAKIGSSSRASFVKYAVQWTGQNTLGIYFLHMPLVFLVMDWAQVYLGISVDHSLGTLAIGLMTFSATVVLTLIVGTLCPQAIGRKTA